MSTVSERPPGPGEVVSLDLESTPQAPGRARRLVREALLAWRLPGLVDVVVLAASELVTNAVRHGRPPLRVALRRTPTGVRLDVADGSPGAPTAPTRLTEDGESGRGLHIVGALSSGVTYERVPQDGKVAHVDFGL